MIISLRIRRKLKVWYHRVRHWRPIPRHCTHCAINETFRELLALSPEELQKRMDDANPEKE